MERDRSIMRITNDALWARQDLVDQYRGVRLRPVEEVLLARYRDRLSGTLLEIGCGAGRLTAALDHIANDLLAIDISEHMLAALKARYPTIRTMQADMRDLRALESERFTAIVAPFAVADVLDHGERAFLLDEVGRMLGQGGTLILSGHNLAAEHSITRPLRLFQTEPKRLAARLLYGRRWRRNRARLRPHEQRTEGYAILNDVSHDFDALHYYIDRDHQERQLSDHGFELLECLDLDGEVVPPGSKASNSTELHYIARWSTS